VTWLHVEDRDAVRLLVIDRPERKNAIPYEGWPRLREAFTDFERSEARVLIVTWIWTVSQHPRGSPIVIAG
jgi:enoyl-CoA hydratase/carnithine racemase